MRFGWVLNLDAELELASTSLPGGERPQTRAPSYQPKVRVLAQLEKYGAASRALLGPEDVLVGAGELEPVSLVGRAWCPTPRALATLAAAGVEPEPHPSMSVLRRVNHRRFAHDVGGGLPDQRYVEQRAELTEMLARPGPWMLKRPLNLAGRGQLRAYRELNHKEWSWIDASLATDGLIVEPLVRPTLELSLHGFIWPGGAYELGRACVQEVSERGVFRGARLATNEPTADEAALLRDRGEHVARALTSAGYFGPFGIDAYRYERDGKSGFCALSEINARYTMAFAEGFPRPAHELSLA